MAALARAAEAQAAIPEVVVFDDVPELIAERPPGSIPTVQASPPAVSESETPGGKALRGKPPGGEVAPAPTSEKIGNSPASLSAWMNPVERSTSSVPRTSEAAARLKPRPEDALLLLSRRAVYALAGLLFALSLVAFTAGYLIGRGRRPPADESAGVDVSARSDPVALEGGVIYSAAPGQYKPDAGAVAIALPVDKVPPEKLSSTGLRPDDADESDSASTTNALTACGGAVAWANEDGDFQLVVPQPGEYYVLLISQHAKRPSGKAIAKSDLDQLAAYFADGASLIGADKYSWRRRRMTGVPAPMNQDFGLDGK